MDTAAIALIVALIVTMACGLEITWSLGLACIVAVLLDPNLTFVVISQRIFACWQFRHSSWREILCPREGFPSGWWHLRTRL